ncbi:MAG TPA: hypothetical protein DCR11_01885 [Deltaproteobacteria bacterium]|nr:hypothetical protein [Deltaproteobacteria bacterium]
MVVPHSVSPAASDLGDKKKSGMLARLRMAMLSFMKLTSSPTKAPFMPFEYMAIVSASMAKRWPHTAEKSLFGM